jgi:hypothetical protein
MLRGFAIAFCMLLALPGLTAAELSGPYAPVWMPIPIMTKEQLRDRLGDENLVIADVRYFAPLDEGKIPGAVRYHPFDVENWGKSIDPDKHIVIY